MKRIVSLIPSATEIVHFLGLGEHQVGRSHECDYPEGVGSLPVCTAPRFRVEGSSRQIDDRVRETLRQALSVYQVFERVLEELQPTHVITQSQCDVCAVSLKDVEAAVAGYVSSRPQLVSLQPASLGQVWADILEVARVLGVEPRGEERIRQIRDRLEAVHQAIRGVTDRPRVICLEWLEPLMAAGNWVPELVEAAGGKNLLGRAGQHSGTIDWEEVLRSDPEVVVLMPCGFSMARTLQETGSLSARPGWGSLPAVRSNRVYVTDGNQYFNRPGPRLADSLRILGEILHPQVFQPTLKGIGWRPLE